MLQRLKLLRRLQEVDIGSPQEALALLERVKTPTSSADDRARLAHLIRVTTEVTGHLRAALDEPMSAGSQALSLPRHGKRARQLARAARRRSRR